MSVHEEVAEITVSCSALRTQHFPLSLGTVLAREEPAPNIMSDPKKRILIVEDNPDIADITARVLERNYNVSIASSAEIALSTLDQQKIDFILMDMFLGAGLNGVELTQRLRSDERFKDLPIVAHTANAMSGHRTEALDAGMNDYIAKPYRIKDLEAVIARWI
jgi:CheY-like chemotaxis protein